VQANVEVRTLGGVVDARVLGAEGEGPAPEVTPEVAPADGAPALEVAPAVAEPTRPLPAALPVTHRTYPNFPANLDVLFANKKVRCSARAWIDEKGVAQRIAVVDCPRALHLLAASSLTHWRWAKPSGPVPVGGLEVEVTVPFERDVRAHEGRAYHPGVTWLRDPAQVTSDPDKAVLVRSGTLPIYPKQVFHGDAVCTVELVVTSRGASRDLLIDDCSLPYRFETLKAVRRWKWYPAMDGEVATSASVEFQIVYKLEHAAAGDAGAP
jgi:hypothetical protein